MYSETSWNLKLVLKIVTHTAQLRVDIHVCLHAAVKIVVTWGGAYGVKNVIITFYIWDSSFLPTWTTAQYGLQKFDKATKFLGKS